MSGISSNNRRWQVLLALFAIIVNFALLTVAMAPTHGHSQTRSCEVCQIAHLPFVAALVSDLPGGQGALFFEAVIESRTSITEGAENPSSSRAPPFAL